VAAALAGIAAASRGGGEARAEPFNWNFLYGKGQPEAEAKLRGLPAAELVAVLRKDLAEGKYILTGDLTPGVFADDCRFVDPNNAVDGLARYQQALALLFDPAESALEVRDVRVAKDGSAIEADYVASGVLKLPWRPRIAPWSGQITYTLGTDGLVTSQVDVWNISRFDAIRQTFTPR